MASEINDASSAEAVKNRETQSEVPVTDTPAMLTGPKTTVTPRTNLAPRGKIFEDDVRGTVFWEVAESSEDEDEDTEAGQPKSDEKWGNAFKVEWIKWFYLVYNLN
jgi:YT521-B-like domain